MQKRRLHMLIGVGVVVGLLVAVILFSREPSYHGRSLEVWVRMQFAPPANGEAAEALRQIGTNALPYLLEWIRYETPAWKTKLARAVNPILMKHKTVWQPSDGTRVLRADAAARALIRLGPEAERAIPELNRLMKDPSANASAGRAMFVLGGLGEAGVPPLMAVLGDERARFRAEAAESIGFSGTKRAAPISLLAECGTRWKKDREVAAKAGVALETLKLDSALVALIHYQDTRADAQTMTALLINGFWKARFSEVSVLAALLTNTDPELRLVATNAQRKIDSQVVKPKRLR